MSVSLLLDHLQQALYCSELLEQGPWERLVNKKKEVVPNQEKGIHTLTVNGGDGVAAFFKACVYITFFPLIPRQSCIYSHVLY